MNGLGAKDLRDLAMERLGPQLRVCIQHVTVRLTAGPGPVIAVAECGVVDIIRSAGDITVWAWSAGGSGRTGLTVILGPWFPRTSSEEAGTRVNVSVPRAGGMTAGMKHAGPEESLAGSAELLHGKCSFVQAVKHRE